MRLLDLFCGAGGAAMGYYRAGFTEIVGIDIKSQPRYPFDFVQADSCNLPFNLEDFDVVHASPPCQHYTAGLYIGGGHEKKKLAHPDLIEPIRSMLARSGKPYIIENVIGSPLGFSIKLCGTMFGLRVLRHRMFESNYFLWALPHPLHNGSTKTGEYMTVTSGGTLRDKVGGKWIPRKGSRRVEDWKIAMGIDWMSKSELIESIPPAYTEFIGKQLINGLSRAVSESR